MRVAIDVSAVPARPAGAGVYVLELVRALAAAGDVELDLVAGRGDAPRWEEIAPRARVHPVVPQARPARLAWEQLRGPALARRLAVDVWHGPHYTMPARVGPPAVVTVHDMTFFDHPEWHERTKVVWFRPLIRASARRAAGLVAVSGHTARRLADVLSPAAPVAVVAHGVDHDRFRPEAVGDLELLEGLGVRPPFLAFAGTLEPRKNVPGLVRAFATLARRRTDLQLVLAGRPGWGAADVAAAVASSGVSSRVLRLGYVDAAVVPALFRQSEAVAYPSHEEGFGIPALEALACGAPLVTTTGSAMEEVVEDAAMLVPPGDDGALAAALADLVDDPEDRARLRRRGPEVAAPYTWAACAAGHVDAYRAAASPRPR